MPTWVICTWICYDATKSMVRPVVDRAGLAKILDLCLSLITWTSRRYGPSKVITNSEKAVVGAFEFG